MNIQFTERSQAALQSAQALAQTAGHAEMVPAHLTAVLLKETEGLMAALFSKLGAEPRALAAEIEAHLARRASSVDASPAPSPALALVLNDAGQAAQEMDDAFVSTEHLLLALVRKGDPETVGLFKARGITPEKVEAALAEVRGGRHVTSQNPEAGMPRPPTRPNRISDQPSQRGRTLPAPSTLWARPPSIMMRNPKPSDQKAAISMGTTSA